MPDAAPLDRRRAPTTAARTAARLLLAISLMVGLSVVSPAFADTKGDLAAAKQQLAAAQARLNQAVAEWQQAISELARTKAQIVATKAAIAHLQERIDAVEERLQHRAVVAFENGPASTIDVLLSSGSLTELSDRLEFLGSIAQSDVDLVTEKQVSEEEMRRSQADLVALSSKQSQDVARLQTAEQAAQASAAAIQDRVDELTRKYNEEQAALRQAQLLGFHTLPGAPISVCPVQGPNSFVDSFGWPRPGGRTHQGIDLIAPFGTPVVAVHDGSAVRAPNALGGNAVIVYHSGGTWTYYAHLSSYGAVGNVSTGTVIGYVGSTGDAGSTNHLHFEYHPGGGAAVDPYQALLAVC
jgi:murein DD-endopeptidase MepM/ murein hydrolase activator NlpD